MRCASTEQSRGVRGHPSQKNFTLPEIQPSAFINSWAEAETACQKWGGLSVHKWGVIHSHSE